jgi:hypothetical protein
MGTPRVRTDVSEAGPMAARLVVTVDAGPVLAEAEAPGAKEES